MRFGSDRHGPCAPVACHDGKYETRTSTGTPVRLTWKLTSLSVARMDDTVTAGSARCSAGATPLGARAHDARPPATICWDHAAGFAYQRWETGSHVAWAAPTPVSTSGVSVGGVTSDELWIR